MMLMPPRKAPSCSGNEMEQNEDDERDVRLSEPLTEVSERGAPRTRFHAPNDLITSDALAEALEAYFLVYMGLERELALEEHVPFANEGTLARNEPCASTDKSMYALVANPNTKNLKVRSGSYGSRSSCGLRVT